MQRYEQIKIDFKVTKWIQEIIDKLDKIYDDSQKLPKNSKEFMKLDADYFILCEELDVECKMAARNNKISWEQYDLITTKYQD